jgi:hypothetical protein
MTNSAMTDQDWHPIATAPNNGIPEGLVDPLGWIFVPDPHGRSFAENALHRYFSADRVISEWFHDTPALRLYIDRVCWPWPTRGGWTA